jgi:putative protease
MSLDPLKIPAYLRKKTLIRKETSNFYKAEKLSPPTPSMPDQPRRTFVSPTPAPTPKPKRSRPAIVSPTPFPEPYLSAPAPFVSDEPRRTFVSPAPVPAPTPFEAPQAVRPEPVFTPVGVVTHYLDKIKVVIVKLDADVRVGDRLVLNGENGPFRQKLNSMQINRQNVEAASPGDDIGIKVSKKALVGEMMYVIG